MPEEILADVVSVFPNKIKISVDTDKISSWSTAEEKLKVGSYLEVSDTEDSTLKLIAIIENFCIELREKRVQDENGNITTEQVRIYGIEAMPLGTLKVDGEEKEFIRGGNEITIPPKGAKPAKKDDIEVIYKGMVDEKSKFEFSSLSLDKSIRVVVDGNKFFNKHFSIVGGTGSGKSHTVAKILQNAISAKEGQYEGLNNSHIILFDIHGEYRSAFPNCNFIDINNLVLPYWLLNSDELEDIFIDSEANDHNQRNVLKEYIVTSKKSLFTGAQAIKDKIHYDSPYLFDIQYVLTGVKEKDKEMVPGSSSPKQGPLFGKLTNFVSRLENKMNDARLEFLLGQKSKDITFEDTLKQFLAYKSGSEANITIIDLSGVPFEVLSVTVSLISRILFQYGYYYKKKLGDSKIETPLLLVYEEAHKYVPKSGGAKYNAAKESIERIAKEGRKYGVTLGIVSQRPSEISETIFSQCNNFIAMRLTNPEDQNYVKRLLPDSLGGIVDMLPSLHTGEGLLIGDSITLPSVVLIDKCDDDKSPNSNDISYLETWKEEWKALDFGKIETEWKK